MPKERATCDERGRRRISRSYFISSDLRLRSEATGFDTNGTDDVKRNSVL